MITTTSNKNIYYSNFIISILGRKPGVFLPLSFPPRHSRGGKIAAENTVFVRGTNAAC
jgi:hypothetical protein